MSVTTTDEPVGYMERTRLYYRALGYDKDYVWAKFDDVPFARLGKPLAQARIALVTTAMPPNFTSKNRFAGKHLWSGETAAAPTELYTNHVAWDKESTHTRDRETFLPIDTVNGLAADGVVGGLTDHFHGVPTVYSQRQTIEEDAPEIWRRIKEDGADAVALAPL